MNNRDVDHKLFVVNKAIGRIEECVRAFDLEFDAIHKELNALHKRIDELETKLGNTALRELREAWL